MTWTRQQKGAAFAAAAIVVLLAAGAGWYFFAPKPEIQRMDAAPAGSALKQGVFADGEPLHHASGTIRVLEVDGRHVLRFEGYDATSGPDVYVYLTPKPRAATTEEVEGQGVKIRTPTMMGQATLRGDFNLDVPEGVDIAQYAGIAIWCETYNVLFGYAELAPA